MIYSKSNFVYVTLRVSPKISSWYKKKYFFVRDHIAGQEYILSMPQTGVTWGEYILRGISKMSSSSETSESWKLIYSM